MFGWEILCRVTKDHQIPIHRYSNIFWVIQILCSKKLSHRFSSILLIEFKWIAVIFQHGIETKNLNNFQKRKIQISLLSWLTFPKTFTTLFNQNQCFITEKWICASYIYIGIVRLSCKPWRSDSILKFFRSLCQIWFQILPSYFSFRHFLALSFTLWLRKENCSHLKNSKNSKILIKLNC